MEDMGKALLFARRTPRSTHHWRRHPSVYLGTGRVNRRLYTYRGWGRGGVRILGNERQTGMKGLRGSLTAGEK
eukprot:12892141-Prorocentrum_lima.AAC.1